MHASACSVEGFVLVWFKCTCVNCDVYGSMRRKHRPQISCLARFCSPTSPIHRHSPQVPLLRFPLSSISFISQDRSLPGARVRNWLTTRRPERRRRRTRQRRSWQISEAARGRRTSSAASSWCCGCTRRSTPATRGGRRSCWPRTSSGGSMAPPRTST